MTTEAFRPEILQSSALRARFLDGTQEVAEITTFQRQPPPIADRWETNCLRDFQEIYHLFASLFLTASSYLLHGLCMTNLSSRLWVLSRHEQAEGRILRIQKTFQDQFLVRSINTYRKDTEDFFLQPPLSLSLPGETAPMNLKFFHADGVCRGMCHWFVQLYFKTLTRFSSSEEHIAAVGNQFSQGASRQAAFLQSLILNDSMYALLNFRLQQDYLKMDLQGKTPDQIIQGIQHCPPGIYGIYLAHHQVIYMKSDDGHQYLFDPNVGCIKIDSQWHFQKAMENYIAKHHPSEKILVDRYFSVI